MRNVNFCDKDGREVVLNYKDDVDIPNGNHVLAVQVFNDKLLFTKHKHRGIELPGGKVEKNEKSIDAILRELHEETGAIPKKTHYIAQYQIKTKDKSLFLKDVFFIEVSHIENSSSYYETNGPCLYVKIDDIPYEQRSFLIEDAAILHCLERVRELGFY